MRLKPKRITASKMDKRITYQEQVLTRNDFGEEIISYEDFGTIWASIEPFKGEEKWGSDQREARITHRIRHLYIAGLSPIMEITFGSRTFEIEAIRNIDERNFEMEVLAIERVT